MDRRKINWTNRTVSFFKNNYTWLSIIPIIIGGLYQFFSISSIGYQYLRFFSLTQFLIDGILLICLFSLLIISLLIYFYITHPISIYQTNTLYESYADEIKRKKNEKSHFIIIIIFLISFTIYLGFHTYQDILGLYFSYKVFLFWFSFTILSFIILNRLFHLNDVIYFPGIGYYEESKLKMYLHMCLHLFFYIQVFLLIIAIEPVAIFFKSFSLSDLNKTHNFTKFLECNKNEFNDFQTARIIYYNDKYLFSEIITYTDTIIKIDTLENFINETCNNK